MPIDRDAIERDLRGAIEDLPVNIRYPVKGPGSSKIIVASFKGGLELLTVIEPGLAENHSGVIVAVKRDFLHGMPEDGKTLLMETAEGWREYEIDSVTGLDDPQGVDVTIVLGSPNV